jgi:hypothetical protein
MFWAETPRELRKAVYSYSATPGNPSDAVLLLMGHSSRKNLLRELALCFFCQRQRVTSRSLVTCAARFSISWIEST